MSNLLRDLSLKEGVKIKVNSKLLKKSSPSAMNKVNETKKTGNFALAPPPPAGSTIFVNYSGPELSGGNEADIDDDDDFGEFA